MNTKIDARKRRDELAQEIREASEAVRTVEREAARALVAAPADGVPGEYQARIALLRDRRRKLIDELRLLNLGVELARTYP